MGAPVMAGGRLLKSQCPYIEEDLADRLVLLNSTRMVKNGGGAKDKEGEEGASLSKKLAD